MPFGILSDMACLVYLRLLILLVRDLSQTRTLQPTLSQPSVLWLTRHLQEEDGQAHRAPHYCTFSDPFFSQPGVALVLFEAL